jgi:uncharacterized protein (DUF1330 family)
MTHFDHGGLERHVQFPYVILSTKTWWAEALQQMAKGYWIAHVDVNDAEGYKSYQAANAVAFRKYGGRFLVRAGASENLEGKLRSRHVIIEFKDYDTALACYRSPEYAGAKEKRNGKGEMDLAIVDGYDGVQPG